MDRSTTWVFALLTLLFLGAAQAQSFVPCYDSVGTSLEGMLIGVTATAIEDDSCSWIVRYQFRQLQKNITTLTKLSAIVIDLGTTEQDVVDEYSCWAGCVNRPIYDSETFADSLTYPWQFNFNEHSCACMSGNYTFEIALTGASLEWGAVGVISGLGESMMCPTIVFAPCSSDSSQIDMSGVCPLENPLGEVDPSKDNCTNVNAPTPSSSPLGGGSGMSGGAIAGVVVGVVAGVVLVGGVAGAAIGSAGYLIWKAVHKPAMDTSMLDATEALDFQINTGFNNPVYVEPSHIIENAAYQTPI